MKETTSDQDDAVLLKQAINDNQALSTVAKDIQVTVKDGDVTLKGNALSEKQVDIITNTVMAVGDVDQIDNQIEVSHAKTTKDLSRADDDGLAIKKMKT